MQISKKTTVDEIPLDRICRVTEMGNITEIMSSEHRSFRGYVLKVDKDHFIDLRTGEYREFEHTENRSQSTQTVAKSLKNGRDLLNANITDVSHCRWVTLTYAENMTNPKKLYFDFKNCVKRLHIEFGDFEYIVFAEPQGRGAWHLHCVFIFGGKAPFMANEIVSQCWKQGFVTVKRLDNVDNVGAYLTAYLGDMELSEVNENDEFKKNPFLLVGRSVKEVEFEDENGIKQTKRFVKGARLDMYPPGFRIYRYSKGIKKPTVSLMSYKSAKEKVRSDKQTFSKTVSLKDDVSDFENTLTYEYYNKVRK